MEHEIKILNNQGINYEVVRGLKHDIIAKINVEEALTSKYMVISTIYSEDPFFTGGIKNLSNEQVAKAYALYRAEEIAKEFAERKEAKLKW